jgi:hypothetical protein
MSSARATLDAHRHAEAEAREEGHELVHRKAADLLVDEGRDVGLIEAEEFAGLGLRQPALADFPAMTRISLDLSTSSSASGMFSS